MGERVAGEGGLEKVVLRSGDGATADVYLHGAHVTSWCPSPGGRERLFVSRASEFHDDAAIRGGIPVIFPQFALEGPLPRHGFVRTRGWALEALDHEAGGDAVASFTLADSSATRGLWPHAFKATIVVRVGGERLTVTMGIENTGDTSFDFHGALHTYLRADDVSDVELVGLHGTQYRDQGARDVLKFEQREVIRVDGELDRVFVGAPSRLTLREPTRELAIETEAFPDVVVWNPGAVKAAAMTDMEPGGEKHMICVEAAIVQQPITLDPGRRWSGWQRLVDLARAT